MTTDGPICDFCSTPDPAYAYPCNDLVVTIDSMDYGSTGAWLACAVCSALIDGADFASLFDRVLAIFAEKQPPLFTAVTLAHHRKVLPQIWARFRAERHGERIMFG